MQYHVPLFHLYGRTNGRRGIAIIITALMLTCIIPMIGLVIDGAIMYAIRAKLAAACDAAALSAARSLSTGITLAEQEAAATARAEAFFAANFAEGTLATAGLSVNVQVSETSDRSRSVSVSATTKAPVYFMNYLGAANATVGASGVATRRDVNVMLVVDRSGSLQTAGACDDLESAARAFVGTFANERDRMGLITFGGSYRVDYSMTRYFKSAPSLSTELDKLFPGGCTGATGSAQALWAGYQQLVNLNEPGALNVLVFFTDGQPNTVTAEWNVRAVATAPDMPYTSRCYDWANSKRYNEAGWAPTTQKYLGWMGATTTNTEGVKLHTATAMPVADDRIPVTNPVGYTGEAQPESEDCYWRTRWWWSETDVPYYPDSDYYGNSMFGYKAVNVYPSGHPYAGRIRMDEKQGLINAAVNAVDNAARRIRERTLNANLPVTIHVVGLGGAGAAEHELLRRIANSKDSPTFDQTKPEGLYLFAPSAAELGNAFARIGGEILRLSK